MDSFCQKYSKEAELLYKKFRFFAIKYNCRCYSYPLKITFSAFLDSSLYIVIFITRLPY